MRLCLIEKAEHSFCLLRAHLLTRQMSILFSNHESLKASRGHNSPRRGTGLPLQVELPPSGSVFSKWVIGITHSDLLHSSCDSFISLVLFWKHISLLQNAMLLCMWLCVCADWEVEMLVGKQLVDQLHSQSLAFSYGWSSRVPLRTRSI